VHYAKRALLLRVMILIYYSKTGPEYTTAYTAHSDIILPQYTDDY